MSGDSITMATRMCWRSSSAISARNWARHRRSRCTLCEVLAMFSAEPRDLPGVERVRLAEQQTPGALKKLLARAPLRVRLTALIFALVVVLVGGIGALIS